MTSGHQMAAQVSLYPLRQLSIGPAIREAVRIFEGQGLRVRVGEMSTLVWGEEHRVFQALQRAFHHAAQEGDAVMCVTLSNACPGPGEKA
ncbi:MAG: thiamine-binding protein [Anaerolineae bacterium]|nr:thiamine-binding protein [Anaerolineae bacterium]